MYKLYKNTVTNEIAGAVKQVGDTIICFMFSDPANTDYAEYLKWVEAGNQPLPPEEN